MVRISTFGKIFPPKKICLSKHINILYEILDRTLFTSGEIVVEGQMAERRMVVRTFGRKTYERNDKLLRDIWSQGVKPERQTTEWIYGQKTSDRKDIWPKEKWPRNVNYAHLVEILDPKNTES